MRGADSYRESLFSTMRLEEFVPADHPLRKIRLWVNKALSEMDTHFSAMYATVQVAGARGLLSGGHFSPTGTFLGSLVNWDFAARNFG